MFVLFTWFTVEIIYLYKYNKNSLFKLLWIQFIMGLKPNIPVYLISSNFCFTY